MHTTRLIGASLVAFILSPSLVEAQVSARTTILVPRTLSATPAPMSTTISARCAGSVTMDGSALDRIAGTLMVQGPKGVLARNDFNTRSPWSGEVSFLITDPGWYYCSITGTVWWRGGGYDTFSAFDSYQHKACTNRDNTGTGVQQFPCDPPRLRTFHHDACPTHDYDAFVLLGGYSTSNHCLGRCGSGCDGTGTRIYSYDCGDHDTCCRDHNECYSPADPRCGDEWREATDDFSFGTWDCNRGGPYLQQQTTLLQQVAAKATIRTQPLTLAAAAERAKTTKGGLPTAEKAELATRGDLKVTTAQKSVTASFGLDNVRAVFTATPQAKGAFQIQAHLQGAKVVAIMDPVNQVVTIDGNKATIDARMKVLLAAMAMRLESEGWARGDTTPPSKEYAYRFVNLLSEVPVGYPIDRFSEGGSPKKR